MAEQTRRERKKEETRLRIVTVAMELFERQGYAGTTTEQIAEAADVAKGTLFNYFPVKEAIIGAFMRQCARDAAPEVERLIDEAGDTRTCLQRMFEHIARWQMPHRELLEHYLTYRMGNMLASLRNPELRSGFDKNLQMVLQRGQVTGELRCDLPLPVLSSYLESAYLTVMLNWLTREGFDLAAGLGQMVDIFLSGAEAKPPLANRERSGRHEG